MNTSGLHVVFLGTDPGSKSGGIANAIPGYISALDLIGIESSYIVTHDPSRWSGKVVPWLRSFMLAASIIFRVKDSRPIFYLHVGGGWPSVLRKFCIGSFLRIFKTTVVYHLHGPEFDDYLENRVKRLALKAALSPADVLVVLTPWWERRLMASGFNKNICICPNPLSQELEKIANTNMPKLIGAREINVLCMTRLEPGKGVDRFIRAMAEVPKHYRGVVAGAGSRKDELLQLVLDLGLENRISFVGWVSGSSKQKLFEESDLFCVPSTYDSFGMGYIEAMANGLPVVALKYGAIPDVVAHGETGFLSDSPNPREIADCLRRLEDSELRRDMGVAGRKWVLKYFSLAAVGQRLASILCQVK